MNTHWVGGKEQAAKILLHKRPECQHWEVEGDGTQ
jgi:hypothetical protein